MAGIGGIFNKIINSKAKQTASKELTHAMKQSEKLAKEVAKRNLEIQGISADLEKLTDDLFTKSAENMKKLNR